MNASSVNMDMPISPKNCMSTNSKQQKDIKRGRFKHQYLVYCRKSTDDTENQKNSLDHQEAECLRFAEVNELAIAPVTLDGFCTRGLIRESHSGFKEDTDLTFTKTGEVKYRITRPKFNQLIQHLNDGDFAGILCMSWDRLSRNKTDNAIITKLIKNGCDVRFVTATYDDTSAGALHMDIDGMFAQHHSRVTKEKVTNAMHKLRDDGIVVYMAPLGYVNTGKKYKDVGTTEHKPFDPIRAPIIKDIFELYATGTWSMSDLATWANEQGLMNFARRRPRTKAELLAEEDIQIEAVEKPITRNNIHYILGNPFYTGLMQNSQNEWIRSKSHKPLIEAELFQRVQEIKGQKQVSVRYKNPIGHALRGFVRCAACLRVYTPYTKKGIQYFGSRCAPGCQNTKKSCNLGFIEDQVGIRLTELFLTPEQLQELDSDTDDNQVYLKDKQEREQEQAQRRLRKLHEDLGYFQNNRLELLKTGVYSPESFVAEEQRLQTAIDDASEAKPASPTDINETMQSATKLSELLKNLTGYYELANSPEREAIARCLFSELSMDQNTFEYSLKSEFNALKREGVRFGAPNLWLSELPRHRADIENGIQLLETLALPTP